jgi:hypothetical protein
MFIMVDMDNETLRTETGNNLEKKKELLSEYIESALKVLTDLEEILANNPNNKFSSMLGRIKLQLEDPGEFKESTQHGIKHFIGNLTNTYTTLNFIAGQLGYESQLLSKCGDALNELKPD